jgi:hypothetical protein
MPTVTSEGFLMNVRKTRGCWRWIGRIDKSTGYGRLGRNSWAHRESYKLFVGPIPDGMTVEHVCHTRSKCDGGPTCRHRACVNPAHLALLTPDQNKRAGANRKTHCPAGHRYTKRNTYFHSSGHGRRVRKCRTCVLARQKGRARH